MLRFSNNNNTHNNDNNDSKNNGDNDNSSNNNKQLKTTSTAISHDRLCLFTASKGFEMSSRSWLIGFARLRPPYQLISDSTRLIGLPMLFCCHCHCCCSCCGGCCCCCCFVDVVALLLLARLLSMLFEVVLDDCWLFVCLRRFFDLILFYCVI